MAGMFTVAAAMSIAGVLLSAPSSRDIRLIAPSQEHNTVQGVSKEHLYEGQVTEIPIQTSRRSLAGLLNWMTRELHGCPSRSDDPISDSFG
jgi:hypothetical protein